LAHIDDVSANGVDERVSGSAPGTATAEAPGGTRS
jgi:hypothetical protein